MLRYQFKDKLLYIIKQMREARKFTIALNSSLLQVCIIFHNVQKYSAHEMQRKKEDDSPSFTRR